MIKEVPVEDMDKAAELGTKFFQEAGLPGTLNPELFKKNWTYLIASGTGKMFGLYEEGVFVGAIGVIISPDLNDGELVASEAFWFIHPSKRGGGLKLLLHFLSYAKEIGCVRVIMVHLFNQNREQLSKLYTKLGFAPVEVHYVKTLIN